MVAIIRTGTSIRRTFHYNENKVEQGAAKVLLAQNYPMDADRMSSAQRMAMLLNTAALNPKVKRNSVHITLNFAPGERLEESKLIAIADDYMERIGFGNQPYLVYQHHDAGHPHLHIATTLVQHNRKAIRMQNIGKLLSEPARVAIEKSYGLVAAQEHKRGVFQLPPLDVQALQYGRTDLKRGISTVLDRVLMAYKYTSLGELNAVLNLYNVHADRGEEGSTTHQRKGLYYRLIDADGNLTGVPLKASLFHQRPTLRFLEKRFLRNHAERKPHYLRVKNAIDMAFAGRRIKDVNMLGRELQRSGIKLVARTNEEGRLYGITFIDHTTKCVFNGSALGKEYSANGISERLLTIPSPNGSGLFVPPSSIPLSSSPDTSATDLMELLMQPEYSSEYIPFHLRHKKKKRKKKRNNNPNP